MATDTGVTLIHIPAGEVESGDDEFVERKRTVNIVRDFWMSDREITNRLFLKCLNDKTYECDKPEKHMTIGWTEGDLERPVIGVNWYDAAMFCNWLSRKEGLTPCYTKRGKDQTRDYRGRMREYDAWLPVADADGYRLPSEAEWEYACRAGSTTMFSCGDDESLLDRYAAHHENVSFLPNNAGSKLCNAWGLLDMHGNVEEWCSDWHKNGYMTSKSYLWDVFGREYDSRRVCRGGSLLQSGKLCRSALRLSHEPDYYNVSLGFRVAAFLSASQAGQASQASGVKRGGG